MLKLSHRDIDDDIEQAKKKFTKSEKANHQKESLSFHTIIQQVNLCRKVALIDDILCSRRLRNSTDDNAELISLRTESLLTLQQIAPNDRFVHFDRFISPLHITERPTIENRNDKIYSYIVNALDDIRSAEDEESYISNVLKVVHDSQEALDVRSEKGQLYLPLSVVATLTNSSGSGSSGQHKDISKQQAIRDVERDVLLINGKRVVGSTVGYSGVNQSIKDTVRSLFPKDMSSSLLAQSFMKDKEPIVEQGAEDHTLDHSDTLPLLKSLKKGMFSFESLFNFPSSSALSLEDIEKNDNEILDMFSSGLLRAINRTESGHWSFAVVSTLCLNTSGLSVVVPDSSAATPLTIELSIGPLSTHFDKTKEFATVGLIDEESECSTSTTTPTDVLGWGIRAHVETTTVYDIYDSECTKVMFRMEATFRNDLVLPIGQHFSPETVQGKLQWERLGSNGSISIDCHFR